MNFQIRIVDSNKCGTYLYFTAEEDKIIEVARETANAYLKKGINNHSLFSFSFQPPFKPVKTLNVVEYDNNSNLAVRGGKKFKLRLGYLTMKYEGGSKSTDYWYE